MRRQDDDRLDTPSRHRANITQAASMLPVWRLERAGTEGRKFVSMSMHIECEKETHDWDEMDWETFSPGDLETRIREDSE